MSVYNSFGDTGIQNALIKHLEKSIEEYERLTSECVKEENSDYQFPWEVLAAFHEAEAKFIKSLLDV